MPEPIEEALSPSHSPREVELEDRIRKLEAALAERPIPSSTDEETLAERVMAKMTALIPLNAVNGAGGAGGRVLVLDNDGNAIPPPPSGAVLRPPEPPSDPAGRRWFFTQLWAEIRLIMTMYLDSRYRVSRLTQIALPLIAILVVANYFLFSWVSIPLVSLVLERLIVAILGVLTYKILTRETARYREVLEYLARYGR